MLVGLFLLTQIFFDASCCMAHRVIAITNCADSIPALVEVQSFIESLDAGSANTVRAYEKALTDLVEFVAERKRVRPAAVLYLDINRVALEAFGRRLSSRFSTATVSSRIGAIKAFTRYMAEKHDIANRGSVLEIPTKVIRKPKGLSATQYRALLATSKRLEPRNSFLLDLLRLTGMRCEEARCATLGQISDDFRFLVDIVGKGEKLRTIPISANLRRSLMRYMEWRQQWPTRPEYPLLVSAYGYRQRNPDTLRMGSKTIWTVVNDAMTKSGIPKGLAHPHTLRHTFAYHTLDLLGQRTNNPTRALEMLAQLLGHSDIEMTLRYVTSDEQLIGEYMEELA